MASINPTNQIIPPSEQNPPLEANQSSPAITVLAGNQFSQIAQFLNGRDAIGLSCACRATRYNNCDSFWEEQLIKDFGEGIASQFEPGEYREAYIKNYNFLFCSLPRNEILKELGKEGKLSLTELFEDYVRQLPATELGLALGQCTIQLFIPLMGIIMRDPRFSISLKLGDQFIN